MNDSGEKNESNSQAAVPRKVLKQKPQIVLQEPVPVGHARVILAIEEKLASGKEIEGDPCSASSCRAKARVVQVQGFGAAFTDPITNGQQVEVYFPMTMAASNGKREVVKGDTLVAEVQSPLVGATFYTVSRYEFQK
ncbi:hypothetical protein [Rufibacter roseus]|uniref:Uncharacterized protein n=1 Tax=Rufibacter roseus TaxID=1567108 RepID=A0ABW2DL05_9BACT|nr:hypothetical protein [Rufibacter roseus]